ncbi:MAG: hypothetical protein ACRDQF_06155, partial [Thermocrispum sp.]
SRGSVRMRRWTQRLVRGSATALLVLLVAGGMLLMHPDADSSSRASEHSTGTSSDFSFLQAGSDMAYAGSEEYNAEVSLGDGRRVVMYYARRKGLVEQHYSPEAGMWSRPTVLYSTKTDPCQGIDLTADSGTVTAIADFGVYCYDGEPPEESLAAVATGDLSTWDFHVTRGFDGWERSSIGLSGGHVEFARGGATSLTWLRYAGFVFAEGI